MSPHLKPPHPKPPHPLHPCPPIQSPPLLSLFAQIGGRLSIGDASFTHLNKCAGVVLVELTDLTVSVGGVGGLTCSCSHVGTGRVICIPQPRPLASGVGRPMTRRAALTSVSCWCVSADESSPWSCRASVHYPPGPLPPPTAARFTCWSSRAAH